MNVVTRLGLCSFALVICFCFLAVHANAQPLQVDVVDHPSTAARNDLYAGNRAPLMSTPYLHLPFGAIAPQGWIRKQLELEANGFTGHLTEISPFCRKEKNAWLNPLGQGDGYWEEVPYWFRGFAALGYVLRDERIIKECQPWIEAAIASQTEFGYFGPNANLFAPVHPPVPAECFTTADGKPGLKGEYFSDRTLKDLKLTRVDAMIDFDWGRKPPVEGLGKEHYSVRWTGRIAVKETGDYQFSVYCDDGAKLWIDDKLIVNDWNTHPGRTTTASPLHMEAGKAYELKLEYFQDINGAEVRLGWKKPGAVYEVRDGVPDLMPNMNMVYALCAYYEYSGDKRVLDLLSRYFRWQLSIPDKKFFSGGWQVPRNGDDLDCVYWLYNRTGEPFLLELAAKIQRCGSTWMNIVTGGHNVDFSQGFRKPALFYQQNNDRKFLDTSIKNWESIMGIYGQVPGGMFGGDEFARPKFTDPRQAIETCGAVEMILSEQIMFRITGDIAWADRCENVAFNTLPACFTADMKALRYLTSPNQTNSDKRSKAPELADGGPMQVMNPHDHRCCQHNSGTGWPNYAQVLWQATPGNGLAAVYYGACDVRAKVGKGEEVVIQERTNYPFDGRIELTLACQAPTEFPLYLRVPGWCGNASLTINGQAVAVQAKPASCIRIQRTWSNNDKVVLTLPMEISITRWAKNSNSASVNRGPLTFSLKIGEQYAPYEPKRFKEPWPAWEILPTTPWNYALDFNPDKLADAFREIVKPWPANNMPFTHEGVPLELQAKARKLSNWKEDHIGLVDKLQPSPVKCLEPLETVTLIPMGAARLRISAFPVIGTGADAREWQLPAEPLTSYCRGDQDPYEAMFDGKVPQTSFDRKLPRFTTYSFGGAEHGKKHWVQKNFDKETTVSSCEVFWYDESSVKGDVRLPKWWRVVYLSGKEWKEVESPSGYGVEADKFNKVTFKPVATTALRLEVQCQDEGGRYAMGIYEWKIGTAPAKGN